MTKFEKTYIRNRIKILVFLTIALILLLIENQTTAAIDGELGSESEGQIRINLKIKSLIKIHGLTDIDLGDFPNNISDLGKSTRLESELHDFLVYCNVSNHYQIEFSSLNSKRGNLSLSNGSGATIDYVIFFYCNSYGGEPRQIITANNAIVNGDNASQDANFDSAEHNAAIRICLDISTKPYAGTYSDILTIRVSPY